MVQTPMCWFIIATPYQIATELGSGELAIYRLTMAKYNDGQSSQQTSQKLLSRVWIQRLYLLHPSKLSYNK